MIDWANLLGNSLWIVGLALALATLSIASWKGSRRAGGIRSHTVQAMLSLSGALFCVGLAATGSEVWEQALWGVLALVFLLLMVGEIRQAQS